MEKQLEDVVLRAGTAYSEGRFEEALQLYQSAIVTFPTNSVLYANLSAILIKLDKPEEALKQAEKAVQLNPQWGKSYYRKGEALRRLGNLSESLLALCQGIRLDPTNSQISTALVQVAQKKFSDFPQVQLCELGLEKDAFTILTTIGQCILNQKQPADSIQYLTWALSLDSPSLKLRESALSSLAAAYFQINNFSRAIEYYEQQLEVCQLLGGNTTDIEGHIAKSAEMMGQWKIALKYRMKRMKTILPVQHHSESLLLAELHLSMKQPDDALSILESIRRSITNINEEEKNRMQIIKAAAYAMRGEHQKALAALNQLDGGIQHLRIIEITVECHLAIGQLDKAVQYLNQALEVTTNTSDDQMFARVCCILCEVHISSGKYRIALNLAKKILSLARNRKEESLEMSAYSLLSRIYESQGDFQSAALLVEKSLTYNEQRADDQVKSLLRLGKLYEKLKKDALPQYEKALRISERGFCLESKATVLSTLFRYMISLGRKAEASEYLEREKELLNHDLECSLRSLIFEDCALLGTEGSSNQVLSALEQSLTEAQDGNNSRRELEVLEKMAVALEDLERMQEAEGFRQQFVTLATQLRLVPHMARGFGAMARLKSLNKDWIACGEFARRSLTLFKILKDQQGRLKMLMLLAKTEFERTNYDLSRTVLEKSEKLAETLQQPTDLVKIYRIRADVEKATGQHKKMQHYVKKHISLFGEEENVENKCRSLVDLANLEASVSNTSTTMKIIKTAQQLLQAVDIEAKADILLDIFDIYISLSQYHEAKICLDFLLSQANISNLSEILKKLQNVPTKMFFLSTLSICERYYSEQGMILLATVCPVTAIRMIDKQERNCSTILCQLFLCFYRDDWQSVRSLCHEISSYHIRVLPPSLLLQLQVRATLEIEKLIRREDVFLLDDSAQEALYDTCCTSTVVFPVLTQSIRFHRLMLEGDFDLLGEEIAVLDKMICAVATNETDMLSMWYNEMIEDILSNDNNDMLSVFPCGNLEFKLRVAAVIVALHTEHFPTLLQTLETCKWVIDKRRLSTYGKDEPMRPTIFSHDNMSYEFVIGSVHFIWVCKNDHITSSMHLSSSNLSFYEHCLVRLFGSSLSLCSARPEVFLCVSTGKPLSIASSYLPWMRISKEKEIPRCIDLLVFSDHQLEIENVCAIDQPLSLALRKLGDSSIAVLSSDSIGSEVILAVENASVITILIDSISHKLIECFLLSGSRTIVCIEDVNYETLQVCITQLHNGSSISEVFYSLDCQIWGDLNFSFPMEGISYQKLREMIKSDLKSFEAMMKAMQEHQQIHVRRVAALGAVLPPIDWTPEVFSLTNTKLINEIYSSMESKSPPVHNNNSLDSIRSLASVNGFKEFFRSIYGDHIFSYSQHNEVSNEVIESNFVVHIPTTPKKVKGKKKPERSVESSNSGYYSDGGEFLTRDKSSSKKQPVMKRSGSATVLAVEQPEYHEISLES